MKKKGFTLIELLAVIVIIAVIALISTPLVLNYIDESKEKSIENSLISIERAALTYFTNNNVKNNRAIDLTTDQIKLGGQKISKGHVIGNRNNVKVYIYKDNYCGYSDGNNYIIKKTTVDKCDFMINDSVEIASSNKIEKGKTISGYRIYGNTVDNVSLGESSNIITLKLSGKNILDKSQFKHTPLQNETALTVWADTTLDNAWVLENLKPNTTYTVTFDSECVAVPSGVTKKSANNGFYIYSGVKDANGNVYKSVWLNNGWKYYTLNEKYFSSITITTPSELHLAEAKYRVLVYTNYYLDDSSTAYFSTIIYKNVQIEEGSTATSYEPYITPQEYTINLSEPLRKYGDVVDYIDSSINQVVRNVGVNTDGSFYALDKPTYEYIELPSITNLDGTTVVSASDGNVDASNLEILIAK